MIANSGGASVNNEAVVNPNLIMNCDLQKGIVSTKDTYLSLEGGASKTGSGEFTEFWKYEYKTGTYDSCSASINWDTYIGLSLYNYSTNFNGESVEVTLPDGSTSWKYVHTLGDHYFEGAYISATGTVQNCYSCRGKVVTLSALLQGRVKVQLLGTDDALIGELPEVGWEDRYNQVLKSAQFTVPADCTKLSVKVICEPSYRIYETDDIGNTNYDDDTSPNMNIYGLKLELGDAQTLCDANGKLLPQPQDSWEADAERSVAYIFNSTKPGDFTPVSVCRPVKGETVDGAYNSDTGAYDTITCSSGLLIGGQTYLAGYSCPAGDSSIVFNSGIVAPTATRGIVFNGGSIKAGYSNIILGTHSSDAEISGTTSIVVGFGTVDTGASDSCAIQGGNTKGERAIAIGYGTAYQYSIVLGSGTAGTSDLNPLWNYGPIVIGRGTATGSGSASIINGKATGMNSLAMGEYATANGGGSVAISTGWNSSGIEANEENSIAIGTRGIRAAAAHQIVMGEYNVTSTNTADKFILGGGGTHQARKNCLRVTTASGIYATSSYHSSGADYAEMFEWLDGNPDGEDRAGRFVVLNGDKLQLAQPDDEDILGIVSGNASVIGDVFDDAWQGQWMTDIFGRPIMEEVEEAYPVQLPDGTTEMKTHTVIRQKLNPEWNPDIEYVPRGKRKEWDAVGLVGKLVAVDDGTCEVNGYAAVGVDGIATKAASRTPYRVMKRLDETHIQVFIK